jgi:hypothetical protein
MVEFMASTDALMDRSNGCGDGNTEFGFNILNNDE